MLHISFRFDREIEFYEFCKQRLQRQVSHLKKLEIVKEEEEEPPFFDYEDMEPYKTDFEADDYVLLV